MKVFAESDLNNDNAAASVTIADGSVKRIAITGIVAGFNVDLAAAVRLTVTVDGVIVFATPILKAGPAPITWGGEWQIETNGGAGVVVTLPASGAAGTVGDLVVFYRGI